MIVGRLYAGSVAGRGGDFSGGAADGYHSRPLFRIMTGGPLSRSLTLIILLLFAARAGAASAYPGNEAEFFSLERASLGEMLNIKTSAASVKSSPLRETPGLVTVIAGEEIASSGARALVGVLRQLPGFEFAADVQGNLGLGVKGNWDNEGKALLIWDGQPYDSGHAPLPGRSREAVLKAAYEL